MLNDLEDVTKIFKYLKKIKQSSLFQLTAQKTY